MWSKLLKYIGCLLFGLILIIPYQMQFVKLGLALILLFPYVISYLKEGKFAVNVNLLIWLYIYVFMGLFYITYALFRGNPAPMSYFPVYVLWPILFYFLSIQVDKDMYMKLILCMRQAFTIIAILGIVAFVQFNLSLNTTRELFVFESTVRQGYPFVAIASGTVTNMIFLYVFFWSLYLIDRELLNWQDKLNLVLGFLFIFATSRRVIFMILAISILLSIMFVILFDKSNWRKYLKSIKSFSRTLLMYGIIIVAVVIQFDLFDFEILWEFVSSATGSNTAGVGYDPRLLQLESLLDGWMDYPILGNATGVDASVIRSETPGMYELSYMALLFERGVVGALVYVIQFLLLNYWVLKSFKNGVISKSYSIAVLVAFDMFMFANATNPYLYAFDHLWVIFLVLAIINLNQKFDEKNLCIDKSL